MWIPQQTFENTFNLKYGIKDIGPGIFLSSETVDRNGNVGLYTNLDLDSNHNPHISYYDETNGNLKYSTGDPLRIGIVDEGGLNDDNVGMYSSIAIDIYDTPHISYYDGTNGDLLYAKWIGPTIDDWDISDPPVDSQNNVGKYSSIAVDSNGDPHISYYDESGGRLKYARLTSGMWETSIVDDGGPSSWDVGRYSSIALDSVDTPHISYYDYTNGNLMYAVGTGNPSNPWDCEIVDSGGIEDNDVGAFSSIALSNFYTETPYISYYDSTSRTLKYAKQTIAGWSTSVVDGGLGTDVGQYTSIDFGEINCPYISYYDATLGDLKMAQWTGGAWMVLTLDDWSDTGVFTSIEVTIDGDYHISYGSHALVANHPATAVGCDEGNNCEYVHTVWVERELQDDGSFRERVHYRRSPNGGETWNIGYRPISSTPETGFEISPPAIYVVGQTIHVTWMGGLSTSGQCGVYYQLSQDNGEHWLMQETRIDDLGGSGRSIAEGAIRPSLFATDSRVHIVWLSRGRVLHKSAPAGDAGNPDSWGNHVGMYSSIAVNRKGYRYISYYDSTFSNLMFSGSLGGDVFETQIVDNIGSVGKYSSIALEHRNYPYPHIAYYDETNGDLKYAKWTGSTWETSFVDNVGFYDDQYDEGRYISIALDSGDIPHICYHDEIQGWLKYARWTGDPQGDIGIVDDGLGRSLDVGEYCSIALDSNDVPHISYHDRTNGDLLYAKWVGPTLDDWDVSDPPIDSGNNVGKHSSIAVDGSSRIHISYSDDSNHVLKYAVNDGSWHPSNIVDDDTNVGHYTSIDVDPDNVPYVSYYDYDVQRTMLKLATFVGPGYDEWTSQSIDNDGDVGKYSSIAIDSDYRIHVGYFDHTNNRLKYYTSAFTWHRVSVQREELLSSPWWGEMRDLRYGLSGAPDIDGDDEYVHVVFTENTILAGDLKYAVGDDATPTHWETWILDSAGVVGEYTSIAIDSNNVPYISYYDHSNGWLKCAKWIGPNPDDWERMEVDTDGDVGMYTSIAIGPTDLPHISYYDKWNTRTMYAWYDGANWHTEPIYFDPPSPASGMFSSIAVDDANRPHVAYFGEASLTVFYTYKDGGNWIGPKPVDSMVDQREVSLALEDPSGTPIPHISYYGHEDDFMNKRLKYAYWNVDRWEIESVDPPIPYGGNAGKYSSIELASGSPRISYHDVALHDLKYAEKIGDNWQISDPPVDWIGIVGEYSSLALDSNTNEPRISYFDRTNGNLKFAERNGGSWSISDPPVDEGDVVGYVGLHASLALARSVPKDIPHISYYAESGSSKIYHTRGLTTGDGLWTSLTEVSEDLELANYPKEPRVAVSGGTVHVVWEDSRNSATLGSEIYYKRSSDEGVTWPGTDISISDGVPDPTRFDKFPAIAVTGADVNVVWEMIKGDPNQPPEYSQILYDRNPWNGDADKWGSDDYVAPNPAPPPLYLAESPDIAAIGNDRHIVWTYFPGSGPTDVAYAHRIDSIVEKNPMAYLKGTSAVRVPTPWMGRDQIYIIGGINHDDPPSYSNVVWRYDPQTDTHTIHCFLSLYTYGIAHTSAVYYPPDDVIYVFGGRDMVGDVYPHIMRINPHWPGDCTGPVEALPGERYGTSAVYMSNPLPAGEGILIFGGSDTGDVTHRDITWWRPGISAPSASGALLPTGRTSTSAITMTENQESAFVFGGEHTGGYVNQVVRVYYSDLDGKWVAEEFSAFPTGEGRSGTSAVSDGSYGYILGGRDESHGLLTDILRFNPRGDSETALIDLCVGLPSAREHTSAAYYGPLTMDGGGTYIFGGGGTQVTFNDVFQYVASYDKP